VAICQDALEGLGLDGLVGERAHHAPTSEDLLELHGNSFMDGTASRVSILVGRL
jgi:hypothetical protein